MSGTRIDTESFECCALLGDVSKLAAIHQLRKWHTRVDDLVRTFGHDHDTRSTQAHADNSCHSLGWLGALAVFLAHATASLLSQDEQMVRAASLAMGLTAWFVILPLSFASLITGLLQALGTAWGLFRHYWVLFKLLLTAVATGVLLLKLGPISYLADAAAERALPRVLVPWPE